MKRRIKDDEHVNMIQAVVEEKEKKKKKLNAQTNLSKERKKITFSLELSTSFYFDLIHQIFP